MKRPQEKIKDLVEPQVFDEVTDHGADPARALASYRFTDTTSLLLARWLDALSELSRGEGRARALAGMRGVGKSHTLAAFSALATTPELRAQIADAHVATSARRLLNRRHLLVRVERGTRQTLGEEFAAALARAFGGDESQWTNQYAAQTLAIAASRAGDAALVLVIDTAFGRQTRVKRDDGAFLSELATASQSVNAFVALALDDDIADADGANVALAGTYQIDYLDPEHLYRIADLYVLRKNAAARAALHDIYLALRSTVPGFNWSESRFAALYPIHPLVADVSAAVRLYSQTFAFLPFASSAAMKAVGRPALSLVLLDEVFDRTEQDLRRAPELREAFAAYDELTAAASAQFPVMQRLQAKLILKGLFILSLEGRGATAREMCVALLFYDENSTAAPTAVERVTQILARLAETAPHAITQMHDADGVIRYRFQISASQKFESAIDAAADRLAPADNAAHLIEALLTNAARARFEDYPFTDEAETKTNAADFYLRWRGTARRGCIIRHQSETPARDEANYDWEILLLSPNETIDAAPHSLTQTESNAASPPLRIVWQPAALKADEVSTLRRLHALKTDEQLTRNFGDTARAMLNSLTAQAERIWARIYLDNGALFFNGEKISFGDEARSSATLSGALASLFAPFLDARFTKHPNFAELLDKRSAAILIDAFFADAKTGDERAQRLARVFAAPLGLVTLRGGAYTLEAGDAALRHEWIRDVLALTEAANGEVVPLKDVRAALVRAPYGFSTEAQHLVFAALVAQRRIELVTKNGDRITRRTLDRSIKWDEIAGIARAATILHSAEELTVWARLLIGAEDLPSIADPAAREAVRAGLDEWLADWRARGVLERFDSVPDRGLTRRTWNLAKNVGKTFGAAADAIEMALAEDISLEEGLQRVADAFGDAKEKFAESSSQLEELAQFADGIERREKARAYLAAAEPTDDAEIERARIELIALAADPHDLFDGARRARFEERWSEFHARYTEHYALLHERAMGNLSDAAEIGERRRFEEFLRGAMWREFEMLSTLSIFNPQIWREASALVESGRRSATVRCDLPVRQLLVAQPRCACAFSAARFVPFGRLTHELQDLVKLGLAAYRRTLAIIAKPLAQTLEELTRADDSINRQRARELADAFVQGRTLAPLTFEDIEIIERAIERLDTLAPVRLNLPMNSYGLMTRDELTARLRQWLDDLPTSSLLVEVVSENGT
jgi:hypothetical protein